MVPEPCPSLATKLIGGSALVLGYGGTAATNDIDTYGKHIGAVDHAAERPERRLA
jgi:hypothetical protein